MSGLTEAEREVITNALGDAGGCWNFEECCWRSLEAALPVVEQIVTAHVTEALTDAADLMSNFLHDPECAACDDVRDCIAIVRAAIGGAR